MQPSPLELIEDVRLTLEKVYKRLAKQPHSIDPQIISQLAEQITEAVAKDSNACIATIFHKEGEFAYCAQHAVDVAILTALILSRMKFANAQSVIAAALCMNISYVSLFNQFVFSKPRLNAIQKQSVSEHPKQAFEMLKGAGINDNLWLDCVLYHHETMDGSGFPEGLKEKQIPPMARLLAACEFYCNQVHAKKYVEGQPSNQALIKLFTENIGKYDTKLSPLFYNCLSIIPSGSLVQLDENNKGLIIKRQVKESDACFVINLMDDKLQLTEQKVELSADKIKQVLPLPYGLKISLYQTYGYPSPQLQQFVSGRVYGRPPSKMELVKTRRIIQASDLPVMPEVISEIEEEMELREPDVSKIAHLIGSDMALSALILKTVTKLVTSSTPVQSIPHAITILGLDRLNSIIKTAALTLTFNDLDDKLLNYWEDAQTTALAAARISEELSDITPEEAYMAGLFQSAGCLLLSIKFDNYFDNTFDKAIRQPFSFLEYEQEEYGTDRGLVAYMLCQEWALPDSIKLATYYRYIKSYSQIKDIKVRTLTAVISLASYITDMVNKFSIDPNDEQLSLLDKTLDELMLNYEEIEKMKTEVMIEMEN